MVHKKCFVPRCSNTTLNCDKVFVGVPAAWERRTQWCNVVGRKPTKTKLYCCEEHFNLTEDAVNFESFKRHGVILFMKPDVVPHLYIASAPTYPLQEQIADVQKKRKRKLLTLCPPRRATFTTAVEDIEVTPDFDQQESCFIVEKEDIQTIAIENIKNSTGLQTNHLSLQTISECESGEETKHRKQFSSGGSKFRNFSTVPSIKPSYQPEIQLKIEKKPKLYLGLPNDAFKLVQIIANHTSTTIRDVLIVLKKIKLNQSFEVMAIDFDLKKETVVKIFNNNVEGIATFLHPLIKWPSSQEIQTNLPTAFSGRFKQVQSIIKCLEIQIETSKNEYQEVTWSAYKGCHTVKYLLSSTPNGLINFVSTGIGGRVCDKWLVENCGYLDVLPSGCAVIADRGFKNIEVVLKLKQCELLWVPSLSKKVSYEDDPLRIPSLGEYIDRAIERLRNFNILKAHEVVEDSLLRALNHIVVIACAIVNLQGCEVG